MAYGDFKDLKRRTAADKFLRDKAFNIAKTPKYDGYQRGLKDLNFLLRVTGIYSKYAWVVPLKNIKGVSIVNAFQSILNKSNRKPNKIWVDKGSEFYNRSMKSWFEKMT